MSESMPKHPLLALSGICQSMALSAFLACSAALIARSDFQPGAITIDASAADQTVPPTPTSASTWQPDESESDSACRFPSNTGPRKHGGGAGCRTHPGLQTDVASFLVSPSRNSAVIVVLKSSDRVEWVSGVITRTNFLTGM